MTHSVLDGAEYLRAGIFKIFFGALTLHGVVQYRVDLLLGEGLYRVFTPVDSFAATKVPVNGAPDNPGNWQADLERKSSQGCADGYEHLVFQQFKQPISCFEVLVAFAAEGNFGIVEREIAMFCSFRHPDKIYAAKLTIIGRSSMTAPCALG